MESLPVIVAGTYEEFLLGYSIDFKEDKELKLNLCLASHSHQASVRCVATHRNLLASSGADEYINVYNMISKKEVAILNEHEGTVNTLFFTPDGTHLISGSQDGSIAVFKCKEWKLVKVWKDCHKKANGVTEISVHPSGKLMLSIGADHVLRAWNLVKGRQAYAVNFSKKIVPGVTLNHVVWSPNGTFYTVCIGNTAEVYLVETAGISCEIKCSSKISCVDFLKDDILFLGREDGYVEVHNVKKSKCLLQYQTHKARIKSLKTFEHKSEYYLVSADSQGTIKVLIYKISDKHYNLIEKAHVDADCRVTCLTLANYEETTKNENEETQKVTNKEVTRDVEHNSVKRKLSPKKVKKVKRFSTSGNWQVEDVTT